MTLLYKVISTEYGYRNGVAEPSVVLEDKIKSYDDARLIADTFLDSKKYQNVIIEEYDPDKNRLGRNPDLH
jgi:hypothetical protein|tara:strand:+ start:118 stop:330 length:213 start_codon:yes stop_codon:yes gene_type:complete